MIMKINGSFFGFNLSARGMSIQRKKMDLISQNIANANSVRSSNGEPYQRKYLKVEADSNSFANKLTLEGQQLRLNATNENHLTVLQVPEEVSINGEVSSTKMNEVLDETPGEMVYMPDNPEANEQGYVKTSNVNVINEMVDMIAATRSYEANLQALNSSKQMAKDSLEI
jgi:flagellar basal-body rod protein FlgC